MKSKIIPVVLTAALTSLGTMFLAARYNDNMPYFGMGKTQKATPVNFASYGGTMPPGGAVDFTSAAEGSVKAVVHIKTTTKAKAVAMQQDPFFDDFFGNMFGQRQMYIPPQMGSGSGVVISPDGYIVTNNHVVAGAEELTVTFNDRYTTKAKVVGADPSTDIAVIKVSNEKNLPYMEFGNSDDVRLGQWVLAVGYPLSLDATVTAGIVSAKSRAIGINRQQSRNAIESFIQTDAAVNPGNSGGALVNTTGQLIGINSAIASPTGSYAGYSYAIPANIVRKVVNDLMKYGKLQRAYLGIAPLDVRNANAEQIAALGLDRKDGIYVQEVTSGGGASKAGIQKGDFITQINGIPVNTYPALQEQLARYKPGDNVSVTYVRGSDSRMTTVQLKGEEGMVSIAKEGGSSRILGATVRPLTASEMRQYGLKGGVIVTDPGKGLLATKTNVRKDFIITSVNDEDVSSLSDLQQKLAAAGDRVQISGMYPGTNARYYYGITGDPGSNDQD